MTSSYCFRSMNQADARAIAAWHYDPPYDFYDATTDPDSLAELLDPQRRGGAYFSAFDHGGTLVSFFQVERKGQCVEVGLGLIPDLTVRGLGLEYMLAGLEFAQRHFDPEGFLLSVATFNERAIPKSTNAPASSVPRSSPITPTAVSVLSCT
jgi:[ribosomal protein S18]-alanine N-acetyltransferase